MLPGACYSEWLKQKETQVPPASSPWVLQRERESEEVGGGRSRECGVEEKE